MHSVKKRPENDGNKAFRNTQAPKKVPLLFLDVRVLEEIFDQHFRRCKRRSKVRRMNLAFKKLKVSRK